MPLKYNILIHFSNPDNFEDTQSVERDCGEITEVNNVSESNGVSDR